MKKIKNFQTFNDGFDKFYSYLYSLIKRGGKFASDVWEATKVEGEETKLALRILSKMIKGEDVTDREKQFLKAQSGDIIRILPLVAISGIPIPIPITPLLVMLGKKYGFDFLPKDHRQLLSNQVELPENVKVMLNEFPESGMGYHNVDIILKDGKILKFRKIINGTYLLLNPTESIDVDNIESLAQTTN
jgi:hypothetical protein